MKIGFGGLQEWYLSAMQHDGDFETVEETLSSGSARIQASRRMIDDLDRRLSRGSQLLGTDDADESDPQTSL